MIKPNPRPKPSVIAARLDRLNTDYRYHQQTIAKIKQRMIQLPSDSEAYQDLLLELGEHEKALQDTQALADELRKMQ